VSCAGEGSEGVGSSKLTVSRPLNEKYLAEWLLALQDDPLWDTAILSVILVDCRFCALSWRSKSLFWIETRMDFVAVAKRR
jgi:hypothetical protein